MPGANSSDNEFIHCPKCTIRLKKKNLDEHLVKHLNAEYNDGSRHEIRGPASLKIQGRKLTGGLRSAKVPKKNSKKRKRIKAAGEAEGRKYSGAVIQNTYHPKPKSKNSPLKKGPPATVAKNSYSSRARGVYQRFVKCKFCERPAMPGDGICRNCSSE